MGLEEQLPSGIALTTVEKVRGGQPRPVASLDEALARMRVQNPDLPDELGRFLAGKSTRELPDGTREWTFDPLHRTRSPIPFNLESFRELLRRITVPTLIVQAERGFRLGDEAERVAQIPDCRFVELPAVGHMVHWHAPEALASAILGFLDGR